jgi:ENTS family enterobactin (siderophore) exporter
MRLLSDVTPLREPRQYRFLRGRRALQGTFLIDLNAMVFGMPRALFPALGTGL